MKTYTLRFRLKNKNDFNRLRQGIKTVETRAGSVRRQTMKKGDILVFVCGKEKFSKVIKKKYHFKDIDLMFKKIPFKKVWPALKSTKDAEKIYYSYPNYREKIKKFGILAFELK